MELTEYVVKFQQGDEAAFEGIYEGCYKKIYYFLLSMTKSPEYAQDTAQETFLEAYKSLGTLKNPEAFSAWLMQIAANKAKRYMHKEGSQPVLLTEEQEELYESTPDPNEALLPDSLVQNSETRRLLMDMINDLPDVQRDCVMMFYFSEMPVEKIADIMDCSEGTVKSRLNYARQKLKTGILTFETKEGVRLHSLVPVALLLSKLAEDMPDAASLMPSWQALAAGGAGAGAAAAAATGAAAGAAGTGTGAAVKGGILATIKAKIVASVAAVAVVAGGTAVVANMPKEIHLDNPELEYNIRVLANKPEGRLTEKDVEDIERLYIYDDGVNNENGEYGTEAYNKPAEGTKPMTSLAGISKLPELKMLYFGSQCEQLLTDVETCKNIKAFYYFNYDVQDFHLKDLTVLKKFPKLKAMNIGIYPNTDTSYITHCKELISLYVNVVGLEDIDVMLDITGLSKLQILNIFWGSHCDVKLKYSGTYPELRLLTTCYQSVENMEFLYATPNLESITLCPLTASDLEPVGSLKKLRALRLLPIVDNQSIDCAPLAGCTALETIAISGTSNCFNIPEGINCYNEDNATMLDKPETVIYSEIIGEVMAEAFE